MYLLFTFQENGHSNMYTWILSTGYWEGRAPINPDAVVVVGILCTGLIGGFIYINRWLFESFRSSMFGFLFPKNVTDPWHICWSIVLAHRVKPPKSVNKRSHESLKLMIIIASLYCFWCASQVYLISPRRPAVGEEADLGVLVFLAAYLFFPHFLCILSMHSRGHDALQLPR